MLFRTRRERWLWIATVLYTLLIYSTLSVVRPLTEALRERGDLRLAVGLVFVAAGLALIGALVRRRAGWREWAIIAAGAVVYLVLLPLLERPEERLHLVQYGLLGVLLYAALGERARAAPRAIGLALRRPAPTAVALATLLGWIDEGIQKLLPTRVYDLRDVGLNALAATLAVTLVAALARVRR